MPLNYPKSGPNYASEFQSSALPWVTSSLATTVPMMIEFPNVTRFIMLLNTSVSETDSIRLGFTKNGVENGNHIKFVGPTAPSPIELKTKVVWIRSETGSIPFSLMAGLTTVPGYSFPHLTGSLPGNEPGWSGVG